MRTRGIFGWTVLLAWAGTAAASPGDLADPLHNDDAPVTVLETAAAQPCALKSGLCVAPGARSTIAVASEPVASAPTAAGKAAPVVPRFSRAASVAGTPTPDENQPWTLDLSGTLKRPAWAGNALFIFFDLEDPGSVENRQFTALYQTNIKAGAKLAARVSLSPDDGFRPGHTYRLRVVQLINGKEIVLAESDLSLL